MSRRGLTSALVAASLICGCSWITREEVPVAVLSPALPEPPKELTESSAMTLQSLTNEFEEAWGDFLRELQESFDAARKPNL